MNDLRIVFIQRQFSHYRKALFDELSKHYRIFLLHSGVDSTIKEEKADYAIKVKYCKYWKKVTNVYLFVFSDLIRIKPQIIVHEANPSILSLPLVLLFCKITGAKIVLWGHGYNRKRNFNPYKCFTDFIRFVFLKAADAVILYDLVTKSFFEKYFLSKKLFVAQNTIDTRNLLLLEKKLERIGKDKIKAELGFEKKYNLVYVGRVIEEKRPADLLKILKLLINKIETKDICLHIIGDGPLKENLEKDSIALNLNSHVIFHGAIYENDKLSKLLFASDLMINPGYVGLNVNHAFCFNLPIFTFSKGESGPFHSPEVVYVKHGKTGFFADPFNYMQLANMMENYLMMKELQTEVSRNILKLVNDEMAFENMVNGFKECFNYLGTK